MAFPKERNYGEDSSGSGDRCQEKNETAIPKERMYGKNPGGLGSRAESFFGEPFSKSVRIRFIGSRKVK